MTCDFKEWLPLFIAFLNIHQSGVFTVLLVVTWMGPHETAAVSVHSLYLGCLHNLPPAHLAECPRSFMCYCRNTGMKQIPKYESAQKVANRRKKIFCQDLNPWSFNHESSVQTTKQSHLPQNITEIVAEFFFLQRWMVSHQGGLSSMDPLYKHRNWFSSRELTSIWKSLLVTWQDKRFTGDRYKTTHG